MDTSNFKEVFESRSNGARREGMKYQRGFISEHDFYKFIAIIAMLGFLFGAFVFEGVPAIWHWIKPLIHQWSA